MDTLETTYRKASQVRHTPEVASPVGNRARK